MYRRYHALRFISAVCVLLILAIACTPSAPPAATPMPLRVGLATWPGFGPGFIAQQKGYFKDLHVEFSILDDFSARQAAFTSNQTHLTISTIDTFAYETAKGVNGKAVMILDESYGADAIVAKSGIQDAKALKGKRIAFTKGSPSHFFLLVYLQKHGLALTDVTTIEVDDPGRAGEAFVSGSVDAAVTWEPNITQIVMSGKGHVLDSTKLTPGLIVDIMVVNPTVLAQRRNDVQKFVSGWLQAVADIDKDPKAAYATMAKGLKIPETEFPGMAGGLRYADRTTNDKWLGQNAQTGIDLFNQASMLWHAAGIIDKAPPGHDRLTGEFLTRIP